MKLTKQELIITFITLSYMLVSCCGMYRICSFLAGNTTLLSSCNDVT
jgi:hypothetical protein